MKAEFKSNFTHFIRTKNTSPDRALEEMIHFLSKDDEICFISINKKGKKHYSYIHLNDTNNIKALKISSNLFHSIEKLIKHISFINNGYTNKIPEKERDNIKKALFLYVNTEI